CAERSREKRGSARPTSPALRAGHPVFQFGKIDLSVDLEHASYKRGDETAEGYLIPSTTFTMQRRISGSYARRGYTLSGFYEYARLSNWEPWGNLAEFDPDQK